jgi:hypothetical protein
MPCTTAVCNAKRQRVGRVHYAASDACVPCADGALVLHSTAHKQTMVVSSMQKYVARLYTLRSLITSLLGITNNFEALPGRHKPSAAQAYFIQAYRPGRGHDGCTPPRPLLVMQKRPRAYAPKQFPAGFKRALAGPGRGCSKTPPVTRPTRTHTYRCPLEMPQSGSMVVDLPVIVP